MKKRMVLLTCAAVLLVSSCGHDTDFLNKETSPTKVSIDMPGIIPDDDPKSVTTYGRDEFQGADRTVVNQDGTRAPVDTPKYLGTSIVDDDGTYVYLTSETTTRPMPTPVTTATSYTASWDTTQPAVIISGDEHIVPSIESIPNLREPDLRYYYDDKNAWGFYKRNGEAFSNTGELIQLSDKTYKELIDEYKEKYGNYTITIHYDDHYETYWISNSSEAVRSVLQIGDKVYTTYSKLYNSSEGINYEKDENYEPEEGHDLSNAKGKLLARCEGIVHIDYYHTIFKEPHQEKYYIFNHQENDLYIYSKG